MDRGNRSFTELELRDQQRAFWVDHATWLHSYAISEIKDLDDAAVAYDRLLQGATDYGNGFQRLYGRDAQPELTRLFRQLVSAEGQIIQSVENGDGQMQKEALERFDRIAERIANSLNETNNNLAVADTLGMLKQLKADTLELAQNIYMDSWVNDVAVYDRTVDNAIKLADAQVVGFRAAFPERVTVILIVQKDGQTVSTGSGTATTGNTNTDPNQDQDLAGDEIKLTEADINLHLALRDVVSDKAMFQKFSIVNDVEGLKGSQAFANRLLTNADDIGKALQPYMTQNNSEALTRLLRQHVVYNLQMVQLMTTLNMVQNGRTIVLNTDKTFSVDGVVVVGQFDVTVIMGSATGTGTGDCTQSSTSASTGTTTCPNQTETSATLQVTLTARQRTRLIDALEKQHEELHVRWVANGDAIAKVLANSLPNLEESAVQASFREHLDGLHEVISARIETRWSDEITAYDRVVPQLYEFADMLSNAIIEQRYNQSSGQNTGSTGSTGSCQQSACNSGY
jgi:hypothetical protein